MINYAHRGASEYAPENTLSAFYLGLLQGANGIETDVQQSKDGALVLFHDDDLMRAASVPGAVRDYTLAELQSFRVTGNCTTGFFDRIVTLREFLEKFTPYPLHFAIELKTESVARPVIDLLHEFDPLFGRVAAVGLQHRIHQSGQSLRIGRGTDKLVVDIQPACLLNLVAGGLDQAVCQRRHLG